MGSLLFIFLDEGVDEGGSTLHFLNEGVDDGLSTLHFLNEGVDHGGSTLHFLNEGMDDGVSTLHSLFAYLIFENSSKCGPNYDCGFILLVLRT